MSAELLPRLETSVRIASPSRFLTTAVLRARLLPLRTLRATRRVFAADTQQFLQVPGSLAKKTRSNSCKSLVLLQRSYRCGPLGSRDVGCAQVSAARWNRDI